MRFSYDPKDYLGWAAIFAAVFAVAIALQHFGILHFPPAPQPPR